MIQYIENLKNEYLQTNDEEKKFKIKNKLRTEKETCKRIISEYLLREERIWIKCLQICDHEDEIIKKINEILNNLD